MAHYAYLDEDNKVIEVIVGKDENEDGLDWEEQYALVRGLDKSRVKRCSYNTYQGEHLYGGTPYRKNYPGFGYTYDVVRDAFIPPKKPHQANYVLDEGKCIWIPPVPRPANLTSENVYYNPLSNAWEEFSITDAGLPENY